MSLIKWFVKMFVILNLKEHIYERKKKKKKEKAQHILGFKKKQI